MCVRMNCLIKTRLCRSVKSLFIRFYSEIITAQTFRGGCSPQNCLVVVSER